MGEPTALTFQDGTEANAQTNGYRGASLDADPLALTVQGGATTAALQAAVAWAAGTAYTVGQAVTFGGNTWVARANSTGSQPSNANANWRNVTDKRAGQQQDSTSRRKQFFR